MADGGRPLPAGVRRALDRLAERPLNFDPSDLPGRDGGADWQVDRRLQPLQPEEPGDPVRGGTWEAARRLMRGYGFADPSIVRAHYDPEAPLEGRDMLLEVRFLGLRIRAGCRVSEVYDRTEDVRGRQARVWGWSYRTLKGHFEQGEMHWEVLKWPQTGEVAFRIHAVSRRARDPNPLVRIGFRIFGRREQLRFYDSTCERMRMLTEAAVGAGSAGDAVRRAAREATAHETAHDEPAHEEVARSLERDQA